MSHNHLAEKKLAGLIALELDIVVKDEALGAFIRDNWARIAPLAHLIHEAPDTTKPNPGMNSFGASNAVASNSANFQNTAQVTNQAPPPEPDHTYLRNLAEKLRHAQRTSTMWFVEEDAKRLHKIADKVTS